MPDIIILAQVVLRIFCVACPHKMTKSEKGDNSNIYRILPKVNQVIYTLDTFCMPNIMTLAQAILEIFCSQCPLWVKCVSEKRGIIQSNFDRIL